MLQLAGTLTDGTLLGWAGATTVRDYAAPAIRAAADAAGRPAPRISTALPVCVTDDFDAAHRLATELFAVYKDIPSYRTILDREGKATVADVALIGNEEQVGEQFADLADAGVTDLAAAVYGAPEERNAPWRCSGAPGDPAGHGAVSHPGMPSSSSSRGGSTAPAPCLASRFAIASACRGTRPDAERTPWRVSGNNVERRRHLPPGGWHWYPPDNCSRQEVGIRHPLTLIAACHELTASAAAISSLLPLSRTREPYSASASVITAGDELEPRPSRR